jgi:nucleoid-associated protein YgaU
MGHMPNKRSLGKPGGKPGKPARLLAVAVVVSALLGLAAPRLGAVEQPRREPVRTHVVQAGETLWSVAVRAAGRGDVRRSIYQIQKLNRLGGATIFPGQRLILPAG